MSATSTVQFGRAASLLLVNGTEALDLSNLRFRFRVEAADIETPNTARIRVYNPSPERVKQATFEFNNVILQAGYGTNPGQIFKGTIKQFRYGKETNVDTFLDIFAADGDLAYNFGLVSASTPANSTSQQRINQLLAALQNGENQVAQVVGQNPTQLQLDPNVAKILSNYGGILPRGKVQFGLARSYLRDLANSAGARWSIQNGVLTLVPLDSYLPGEAIAVNTMTGMIGIPEATDQGVTVRMLLNPAIRVGHLIQLNNADITTTQIKQQFFPGYKDFNLIATVDTSTDAYYRVVVVEHEGDTRDQPWYTDVICLLVNPDVQSVAAYG